MPDLFFSLFWFLQVGYDILIIDKISLGIWKNFKNTIINFLHLLLIITLIFYQIVLAGLKLTLHLLNDNTCELFFQTFLFYSEVYQYYFSCYLRFVSRIGQFSCHEKSEILIVSNLSAANVCQISISNFFNCFI